MTLSKVQVEDAKLLASSTMIPWDAFAGSTVVVTGATGLIGGAIASALLAREHLHPSGLRVVGLVRNVERARDLLDDDFLTLVPWDACDPCNGLEKVPRADYLIHCANPTDSTMFLEHPVEVADATLGGARAMLDLARRDGARMCLLSTMEVYGAVEGDDPLDEASGGFVDTMNPRSSYPEAKRMAELLCASYAAEYGVDVRVVRLAQTLGPGVSSADRRAFASFASKALAGEDIVLLTDGTKRSPYLYVSDAVSAVLVALAKGEAGRAFNACDEQSYCSVRELAEHVVAWLGAGESSVRFELDEDAARRFRPGGGLRLSCARLRALGWRPITGLEEGFRRMAAGWEE